MTRHLYRLTAAGVTLLAVLVLAVAPQLAAQPTDAPPADPNAWQIPEGAADEPNPVAATRDSLRKGLQLYAVSCARCHGENGKADGPDADPAAPPKDLSDSSQVAHDPDGVMFYKIWNGRNQPLMPAFKAELSKTDIWTVINFVKTFRD